MSGTICYLAPSRYAVLEKQIECAKTIATRGDWVRSDRADKTGVVRRDERDFVINHLLRGEDRLWVYSLDVLGDSRAEILSIFHALHGLGVAIVSEHDGLDGDMKATAYALALQAALTRIGKRKITNRSATRKASATGGRPRSLSLDQVKEARALREARKSWTDIKAYFVKKGVKISVSTLRRSVLSR